MLSVVFTSMCLISSLFLWVTVKENSERTRIVSSNRASTGFAGGVKLSWLLVKLTFFTVAK